MHYSLDKELAGWLHPSSFAVNGSMTKWRLVTRDLRGLYWDWNCLLLLQTAVASAALAGLWMAASRGCSGLVWGKGRSWTGWRGGPVSISWCSTRPRDTFPAPFNIYERACKKDGERLITKSGSERAKGKFYTEGEYRFRLEVSKKCSVPPALWGC